ncbi:MDR family MFS transporter [Fictibacillus sp. Mic-4]|uniref:MDR family MFS transporter n=1 Tax=Fictibacillus sp. Mic-4 TaxID=3132826 RepID=UPI003CFB984A
MNTERINRNVVLTGLIIGMFFSAMEQTVVGTAMPTIIGELHGFSIFAWVTTAYLITSTTVVPIIGKLSDMYGRRKFYLLGVIIFVIGSGLCATAQTMEQLIWYRGIQGIGGGMLMPLSQTIVGDIFTAEQRAKWQGVFGGIFGLSSVIGPLIGGALVDTISWHWIFLINVPFGLLSGILIFIGMKHEIIAKKGNANIDYLGIITFVPALVLLLLGLTNAGKNFDWVSIPSFLYFGGAIVLTLIFGWIETKAKEPIIDIRLFKNRVFSTMNGLGFLLGLGMFGAISFVPMFMQGILGVSPTQAGSTMTPMMISMIFASIIGGRILLKLRYRTVLTVGMLITAFGFYLMSTMGLDSSKLTAYIYMIIMGFGMGLVMPTLMIAVQNAFPKHQLGAVTSASTFFRSIGGTIGITVLNTVMNETLQSKMETIAHHQANPMMKKLFAALAEKTDSLFSLLIHPEALKLPETIKATVITSIQKAWSESFTTVFLTGLIFLGIGIILALCVGSGKIERDEPKKAAKAKPEAATE